MNTIESVKLVELLLTTFLNFNYSIKKKLRNKLLLIQYSMNEFYSAEKLMQSIMYAYKGK